MLQTGQTEHTDRQRFDSIGRTVLQTVAQNASPRLTETITMIINVYLILLIIKSDAN